MPNGFHNDLPRSGPLGVSHAAWDHIEGLTLSLEQRATALLPYRFRQEHPYVYLQGV